MCLLFGQCQCLFSFYYKVCCVTTALGSEATQRNSLSEEKCDFRDCRLVTWGAFLFFPHNKTTLLWFGLTCLLQ